MRVSIVSDLHLGDEQCALINKSTFKLTPNYKKFREGVGQGNDYLVLAGDILDFSVSKYQGTYECARTFFTKVKKDGLANQLIYLPGNHDANVWQTVEHETNIINHIIAGKPVNKFRHSVPAILDDRRTKDWDKFHLIGVTPQPEGSQAKYGGLYLDKLVDNKPFFNVAHPNLYLVSDQGQSTLITHGQYFQEYWTLAWSLAELIGAKGDLEIGAFNINELVGINFPLVQLACTGVGQAGKLGDLINTIQKEIKGCDLARLTRYLARLKDAIDDSLAFKSTRGIFKYLNIKEYFSDKCLDAAKDYALEKLEEIAVNEGGAARNNSKFCFDPEVQKRMSSFYLAALVEIDDIVRAENNQFKDLPIPETIVFGHTHVPGPWNNDGNIPILPQDKTGGRVVRLLNSGGWLNDKNGVFSGANVFRYETGVPGLKTIMVE